MQVIDPIIERSEALKLMGNPSKRTARRREKAGAPWPTPLVLGANRTGYRQSDIIRWNESRQMRDAATMRNAADTAQPRAN